MVSGSDISEKVGQALGLVILVPFTAGLVAGISAWSFGLPFTMPAVFVGGVTLLAALAWGMVYVAARLFLVLWPLVILAVIVVVVVKQLA